MRTMNQEIADTHARIEAEEGECWHRDSGFLDGYKECEAEVWLRHNGAPGLRFRSSDYNSDGCNG